MRKVENGKTTAQIAAFARALGTREPDPKVRNPDYLAERMLPALCQIAFLPLFRGVSRTLYDAGAKGMYCFHQIRTHYVDAVIRTELEQGLEQLVILGAGLDTRAYRFAELLSGRPVFEVDHPGTQRWKLARLGELTSNRGVRYVAVNFETDNLEERLTSAGFEFGKRTLFLWEGVSMYLTEEAISSTLGFISRAAPGSSVLFDYIYRGMLDGSARYYGAQESIRSAKRLGEPYIFGLDERTAREFLLAKGFDIVSDVDVEDVARQYLTKSDGSQLGKTAAYVRIAHARVRPRSS